ncbi:RloB family protein [Shewanella sp. SM87]|uniref:RloB family protein n=1 Tax=unclassified Shewanella TaxID=196818 RepID=UPI0021DA889F|nr:MULTISPECIES: RloB family protein [unclassified Shewanella]MCU8007109.1 RloB family protein [Shewanella sp. SM87]MCU8073096.1 RloB family protein [Shewanella sp. SM29]
MGSDDIFHKLKAKSKAQTKRASTQKDSYKKFLIVCEDTVSGYRYIKDVVNHYRLSTANVSIVGLGQSPLNIVEHAQKRFDEEEESCKPDFDQVFCVFDRDDHASFFNAIKKIDMVNNKLKKKVFIAIPSDPCFEIWLILHFRFTTKLYEKSGRKSAANLVVDDLKKLLPDYEKNALSAFRNTPQSINKALDNAKRLRIYCDENYSFSPKTDFDNLIDFIIEQHKSMHKR